MFSFMLINRSLLMVWQNTYIVFMCSILFVPPKLYMCGGVYRVLQINLDHFKMHKPGYKK